ncbi:cold shock domain-containing protein [Pedobacter sp. BMA]|uniref:cold shock domain-containing protein n=1 Tax=Pedobacter sp. BMA TaxID=1663685 RepID=UPI00064A575B|nr:cold shock domain-containing protein [Pedobacter sp. BMA]KLT67319.1 hypothetical protein AB669_00975 [Pedobacter sp. BMA]
MRKGIVTYIDPVFGRGTIEDENEQDITFHLSNNEHNLQLNSVVSFEIAMGADGLIASNVTPMRHVCEVSNTFTAFHLLSTH